ncbi:MAG: oligosaccharide flippase family protein, partial [Thermoprotei archaeon]
GAGHLFVGNTLSQIIQGIGIILVARLLGATNYGLYTLLLVPSATFFVFTQMGFGGAASRYVAYYNAQGKRVEADNMVTSAFMYALILYALISVASTFAAPAYTSIILHQPTIAHLAQLASVTIFFQGVMNYTTAALNGYYRTKQVSAIMLIQAVTKTTLSIGLILIGLRIYGALVGTIMGFALSAAAGVFWLFKVTQTRRFKFEAKTFRTVVSFGLPLYAANILNGLSRQIQLVILATFASAAAVGAFTATQNLATLISIVTYPLSTMAGVAFSEVSAQNNTARVGSSYVSATRIATILIVPVSVIVALMAKPIVTVLYGSAYIKYFLLLSIFALGYLSVGLGGQTQAPLFGGLNNTRLNAYSAAVSAALLLSASFGLALRFSVFGVALATTISTVVTTAVMHIFVVKGFSVRLPRTKLAKVYLSGAVSVLPLIYIPQKIFHHGLIGLAQLALVLSAYIVIYSTVLPLMRGVSKEDLDLISHSLKDVPIVGHILAAITKYSKLLVHERG